MANWPTSGERPQSPYYGSADSTPLFLVVLDEYERWTGDADTVRALEGAGPGRAGLDASATATSTATATSSTSTRNPRPAWSTSAGRTRGTRSCTPTARLASLPRACCEIQGYAYDARVRTARLAREVWDDVALADRLERDAGTR